MTRARPAYFVAAVVLNGSTTATGKALVAASTRYLEAGRHYARAVRRLERSETKRPRRAPPIEVFDELGASEELRAAAIAVDQAERAHAAAMRAYVRRVTRPHKER